MNRYCAVALYVSLTGLVAHAEDHLRAPLVTLGRPLALDAAVTPISYSEPVKGPTANAPELESGPAWPGVSVGTPHALTPGTAPSPTANNGMIVSSEGDLPVPTPLPGAAALSEISGSAGNGDALFGCDCLGCVTGGKRRLFESDHAFPMYISPVTSPFLFEDPRALTEVRPIFIYQSTPSSNYIFKGGNLDYFGTQLRLAVTDRLSFVISKLGFIWDEPRDGGKPFGSDAGFAELDFGPKFTFWRNEDTHSVAAVGMTAMLPTGPSSVFQNTGRGSLVPYLSFAQDFLCSDFGSLNVMSTTGYSFALDNRRTDYYYSGLHLDYDVGNRHKFYPLVELNWFAYTSAGSARTLGFEGRDLINFGSTGVSGIGSLTIATGARYKFNDRLQTGVAVEFPLTATQDLINFRVTWDVIVQY